MNLERGITNPGPAGQSSTGRGGKRGPAGSKAGSQREQGRERIPAEQGLGGWRQGREGE